MGDSKTIIHCCVEKDIYDMLIRHCEATGQTKTTAIKRAIKEYCKDFAGDPDGIIDNDGDAEDKA